MGQEPNYPGRHEALPQEHAGEDLRGWKRSEVEFPSCPAPPRPPGGVRSPTGSVKTLAGGHCRRPPDQDPSPLSFMCQQSPLGWG